MSLANLLAWALLTLSCDQIAIDREKKQHALDRDIFRNALKGDAWVVDETRTRDSGSWKKTSRAKGDFSPDIVPSRHRPQSHSQRQRPAAPSSEFRTLQFCDDDLANLAGADVVSSKSLTLKLYREIDGVIQTPAAATLSGNGKFRSAMINHRGFEARLQGVTNGSYHGILCADDALTSCEPDLAAWSFLRGDYQLLYRLNQSAQGVVGATSSLIHWYVPAGPFHVDNGFVTGPVQSRSVYTRTGTSHFDFFANDFYTIHNKHVTASKQLPNYENLFSFHRHNCNVYSAPLVIDLNGDGVELSPPLHGISIDITGDGRPGQVSWILATEHQSNRNKVVDDAFLVMDRNGNGFVDNGSEIVGSALVGPDGRKADNGFAALAKYDSNWDGTIDRHDPVWPELRIWLDANNDGRSRKGELHTLAKFGLSRFDLAYESVLEEDPYGNQTRYRSVAAGREGQLSIVFDLSLRVTYLSRQSALATPGTPNKTKHHDYRKY